MKMLLQLSYTIALVEEQGNHIQAPLVLDQRFSWEELEPVYTCPCLQFKWALKHTFGWGTGRRGMCSGGHRVVAVTTQKGSDLVTSLHANY